MCTAMIYVAYMRYAVNNDYKLVKNYAQTTKFLINTFMATRYQDTRLK